LVGAGFENGAGRGFTHDDADDSLVQSGAVYVFARDAGQWSRIAYAKAAHADSNDQFGYAVGLFGEFMLVGARGESSGTLDPTDDSKPSAGAAYLLR
jgi:hypothetical protein